MLSFAFPRMLTHWTKPILHAGNYERGIFSVKNGIEKGKAGLDLGAEHHRKKPCWVLPAGLEWIQFSTTFSRRALALSLCFQRSNAFHLFWNNGFEIEQFFSHFFKWFSVEVPQYRVLLINTIVSPLWHKCCKVMMSILWGDFHSTQNPGEFGWYIKWNGAFRFGPTGMLETCFEGCLLWPVWSFPSVGPKCPFPFDKWKGRTRTINKQTTNIQTRGGLCQVCATGRESSAISNRNFLLKGKRQGFQQGQWSFSIF